MGYIEFKDHGLIIKGKKLKIASVRDEVVLPVKNPESLIQGIRQLKLPVDLLTFVQGLDDTSPRYNYFVEWDNAAVLHISTYDNWISRIANRNVRKNVNKAARKGLEIRMERFSDELVHKLMEIYNETPLRRGKKFPYYGFGFDAVKAGWATDLDRSEFLIIYFGAEPVGFIKLSYGEKAVNASGMVSKLAHRDKSPMNALIAACVKRCEEKGYSYLLYGKYKYRKKDDDTLITFKNYNGFVSKDILRYYVPFSLRGKLALMLRLHHGIKKYLPEKLIDGMIAIRKKALEKEIIK